MDPFTLMLAAVAAGGELFKGFSASAAYKLQSQVATTNAEVLDKQAEIQEMGADVARAKGAFEQYRLGERVERVLSSQVAHFAAAGLDPAAGSPIVLAMQSAMQGRADAEIIAAGASLEAAGALTQAANTRMQAHNQRYQALAAKQKAFSSMVAGIFGAATSFLKPGGFGGGGGGEGGYYGGSPETNPLLQPI